MGKEKLTTMGVIILILLIAGGIILYKNINSSVIKDLPSEEIAKYIGEHSVLYVLPTCSHCRDQEKLFGVNVKYLSIVDCSKDTQLCINLGIEATPTWIINGEKYVGKKTIEELKNLTGYK